MWNLKSLARLILRKELKQIQDSTDKLNKKLKILSSENKELIQKLENLEDLFLKRSLPVNLYKILDKSEIQMNDLRILKDVWITENKVYAELKRLFEQKFVKEKELFLKEVEFARKNNYNNEIIESAVEEFNQLEKEAQQMIEKQKNQCETLKSIINKLEGIVDFD